MKKIKNMTQIELAAYIQSRLREAGIDVVLSGGSAVTFHSSNKYVSKDLDLVNVNFVKRKSIKDAMEMIGFQEKGRYFLHPETEILVEFPDGPLSVGEEPVKETDEVELPTGVLSVLSPTDCVKDRLCAFYFWGDRQGLAQAVLVTESQDVDLKEVKRWSKAEGKEREHEIYRGMLSKVRKT